MTRCGGRIYKVVPQGNMVGAARIGDWELVVRPKAPFSSVLFMLAHARDPGIAPEEFEGSEDRDLWPMVAVTLERLAGRALAQGVLQGYVRRDDQLTVVRGRIRIGEQIARRHGRPLPLEVRYDDYITDIPENQILRTAVHRMGQVEGVPAETRSRLKRLESRLAGARSLIPGQPRPVWHASRLNRRFVPAPHLAELILDHLGLSTQRGSRAVASFVIDMAQTFERFVTTAVTEAYAQQDGATGGYTSAQYRTFLDADHSQPLRPDIVHVTADGTPDAVLDAKYKLMAGPTGRGPRLGDLYQILAYCTVLELDRGTLVYAAEDSAARPVSLDIVGSPAQITAWPLNVSAPPGNLAPMIATLVSETLVHSLESSTPLSALG